MGALDARFREVANETRILGEAFDPGKDVPAGYVTGAELLRSPECLEVRVNLVSLDQRAKITHGRSTGQADRASAGPWWALGTSDTLGRAGRPADSCLTATSQEEP